MLTLIRFSFWWPLSIAVGWSVATLPLPYELQGSAFLFRASLVGGTLILALCGYDLVRRLVVTGPEGSTAPSEDRPSPADWIGEMWVSLLVGALVVTAISQLVLALILNRFVLNAIPLSLIVGALLGVVGVVTLTRLLAHMVVWALPLLVLLSGILFLLGLNVVRGISVSGIGAVVFLFIGLGFVVLVAVIASSSGMPFFAAARLHRQLWLAPLVCVVSAGAIWLGSESSVGLATILVASLLTVLAAFSVWLHVWLRRLLLADDVALSIDLGVALADLMSTVGVAVLIAFTVQLLIVKPYRVPSGSMEQTIAVGERIIANRLALRRSSPKRDQIMVFNPNGKGTDVYEAGTAADETFVKRIIGLPGETIGAQGGRVYICDGAVPQDVQVIESSLGCEYLDEPFVSSAQDDFGPVSIPADRYFMMGDNRADSDDSRNWGPVLESQMIGPAFFSYWPLNRVGPTGSEPWFAETSPRVSVTRPMLAVLLASLILLYGLIETITTSRNSRPS